MKIKKLKIDGEDKIKLELKFDLDELIITVIEYGIPTKITKKINLIGKEELIIDHIGEMIRISLFEYKEKKELEKKYYNIFESKEHIEILIPQSTTSITDTLS